MRGAFAYAALILVFALAALPVSVHAQDWQFLTAGELMPGENVTVQLSCPSGHVCCVMIEPYTKPEASYLVKWRYSLEYDVFNVSIAYQNWAGSYPPDHFAFYGNATLTIENIGQHGSLQYSVYYSVGYNVTDIARIDYNTTILGQGRYLVWLPFTPSDPSYFFYIAGSVDADWGCERHYNSPSPSLYVINTSTGIGYRRSWNGVGWAASLDGPLAISVNQTVTQQPGDTSNATNTTTQAGNTTPAQQATVETTSTKAAIAGLSLAGATLLGVLLLALRR